MHIMRYDMRYSAKTHYSLACSLSKFCISIISFFHFPAIFFLLLIHFRFIAWSFLHLFCFQYTINGYAIVNPVMI